MKGDAQRKIVKMAAAYAAAGVETDEPLIRRHRKLYQDELESISCILRKAAEMQQRGPAPAGPLSYSDFNQFEVIATLSTRAPMGSGAPESGRTPDHIPEPALSACPVCGASVAIPDLEGHIRDELLATSKDGRIRVTIDPAFGHARREIYVVASSGREVKERIFEELGISVARQLVTANGRVVDSKDAIPGTTVNLKYKKHYK